MAQVRNISGEPRSVPELGLSGGRIVDDGEIATVPDDRFAGFIAQESIWEAVAAPTSDVVDPTIDPASADDDLGPLDLDLGDDGLGDLGDPADQNLGGDQPPTTAGPAVTKAAKAAAKRAQRGNGGN